jgi:predicted S18 family serine protease
VLWSLAEELGFFEGKEWAALDEKEHEALSVRTHVCADCTTVSSRHEAMQNDSNIEGHLKRVLAEWEVLLDRQHEVLKAQAQALLAADQYPQTAEMAAAFEARAKEFEDEWESQNTAYHFQARLSQEKLSNLNGEAHRRRLQLKVRTMLRFDCPANDDSFHMDGRACISLQMHAQMGLALLVVWVTGREGQG